MGITNHFFTYVKNMYSKTKLCIRVNNNKLTDFFPSDIGVRQGDNLSPTLFNIFINDLVEAMKSTDRTDKVNIGNESINCLLYADDVVLMSTSNEGLQNSINTLKTFADTWKLEVNMHKTKIMIFNKKGKYIKENFLYGSHHLECTNSYAYLGINFMPSGSFKDSVSTL